MDNMFEIIGLMSGTSLDGLDIANCRFQRIDEKWSYEIVKADTIAYPSALSQRLRDSITLSSFELQTLDHEAGAWMGKKVAGFIKDHKLSPGLIASHGHTVFHQPEKGITLQIGNAYEILKETGVPVVYDFRAFDVTLGGQGAPLVPVGDKLLFGEYDFCLNLGGISNISFDQRDRRKAFDICPVNIVLNALAKRCGKDYDKDGDIARAGQVDEELLVSLNSLKYYSDPTPKSLGIEWVQKNIFPLLKNNTEVASLLHTFCHHIAFQISSVILNHKSKEGQRILATGGGAFNKFLMELIEHYLGGAVYIVIPEPGIISYKESLVFAFLGMLRWMKQPNVLKSVTGAKFDSSSGTILDNKVFK